eukprot:4751760-Pleurochrysis_carterae.AAC.5
MTTPFGTCSLSCMHESLSLDGLFALHTCLPLHPLCAAGRLPRRVAKERAAGGSNLLCAQPYARQFSMPMMNGHGPPASLCRGRAIGPWLLTRAFALLQVCGADSTLRHELCHARYALHAEYRAA